jgi:hypothetical protein
MEQKQEDLLNGLLNSFSTASFVSFIIFLILKLCGTITWSWWIICLPLIIYFGFWLLLIFFLTFCVLIMILLGVNK